MCSASRVLLKGNRATGYEALNSGFVGRKFVRGQQIDGLRPPPAAAGYPRQTDAGCRFHHQKVEAIRLFAAHRKRSNSAPRVAYSPCPSPDSICRSNHRALPGCARSVAGQPLAFSSPALTMQIAMRQNALHQVLTGTPRRRAASHLRQLAERGQARRDNFPMRGEATAVAASQSASSSPSDVATGGFHHAIAEHLHKSGAMSTTPTGMAFSYLRHQRSAGGTGAFAQLALTSAFVGSV